MRHHHRDAVEDVAGADDLQGLCAVSDHFFIFAEDADDGLGEKKEEQHHEAHEDGVVFRGEHYAALGALDLPGAEILSDQCGGGVAQSPGGENEEHDVAERDLVAGGSVGAAGFSDQAREHDPAAAGDDELKCGGPGDDGDRAHELGVEAEMMAVNFQDAAAFEQVIALVGHARAPADDGGDGCAFQPEEMNEDGAEDDVDRAGDPQAAHGHGRIACAAEDAVDEKDEHDDHVAAEQDAREHRAFRHHLRARAHQAQHVAGENNSRDAEHEGQQQRDQQRLRAGMRGGFRVLLADPARDDGRGRRA